MPNDNSAPLVGRTLANKYTIENVVGTGAMGTIYRARQIALDKYVAVKVLHQQLAEDPSFVDRFKLEAFSASRLEHPNSLRVLDFGKDDELLYLVMEYVEADNLLSIMEAQWPFEDERVAQITSQALAALAKAHDVGIVHRDLKPENILVLRGMDDEGNPIDIVKVCDFGIAKLAIPVGDSHPFAPHHTTEGLIVGTPDYMSPEQARGEDVDGRSDLYSMGVVLYHLLAGKTPFDADTPLGIAVQHVSQEPIPPSALRKVHPELEAVCLRAMSKKAEDRYQSAREMRRALLAAVGAGAPMMSSTAPAATPTHGMRPVQARPRFATSTAPGEIDLDAVDSDETPMPVEKAAGRKRSVSLVTLGILGVATVAASAVIVQRPGVGLFGSREVHSTTVALAPGSQVSGAVVVNPPATQAANPPSTQTVAPAPAVADSAPRSSPPRTAAPSRRSSTATASRRLAEPAPPPSSVSASLGETEPVAQVEPVAPPPAIVETAPIPVAPSPPPRAQAPIEPPAAPAPTAVDPARASVSIGNVTTSSGISGSKVRTAIVHAPFANCYKNALGKRPFGSTVQSTLKIDIDLSGHVVGASLSDDGNLPGLRSCIETAARGVKIRDVDTGDGSATINLTFSPQ
jgi:eukaryotic-like serine/threonine-protein kinase